MKINKSSKVIILGLLVGLAAYGINSYGSNSALGMSIYKINAGGAALGGLMAFIYLNIKPLPIAAKITIGVCLGLLLRIIFDWVFIDSSHHNLLPFEFILCIIISGPFSLVGAYTGLMIRRFS